MKLSQTICDNLGRKNIAERLGVGPTSVSNASVAGVFPASWYLVVKEMCDEVGIECPVESFSFKSALPKKVG